MIFSLSHILGLGVAYLLFLFLVAYISESGVVPVRWLRHPAVYVFSLGVYVSAWSIFGAVGFAHEMGYNFLAYYLGISGAFLIAPVLLTPILRLAKTYQLGSLADLFAYRYRSQSAGSITTIAMIASLMPLLALQIQAVADCIGILTQEDQPNTLALWFCIIITVFTLLFGTRHITPREKHEGLVVAIAVESFIKLIAFMAVAGYAFWGVFDGKADLDQWLAQNPNALHMLYDPLKNGPWHSLILAFLFSAVVMPFMYQMTFTENQHPRHLVTASWGLPLYLFLMSLPVPLLLWAGTKVASYEVDPEYYTLAVAMASKTTILPTLIFIGGVSAASGVIIVTTLAMASMALNHLILPIYQPPPERNLYNWLLNVRRLLIIGLIALSYGIFVLLNKQHTLTEMGMLTFVGTLQFAPGLLGVLFWPGANRRGYLSGLLIGLGIWFVGLVIPFLLQIELFHFNLMSIDFVSNPNYWQNIGLGATVLNTMAFIVISLSTHQSPSEKIAASTCSVDNLRRPHRWELPVHKPQEFIDRLGGPLGQLSAEREVRQAMDDLHMTDQETRPYALRRLRDQLESNLSGLLGPAVAQDLLDQHVPYKIKPEQTAGEDIHYIESRLEEYRDKLSGLAGELDSLRRFHRQTLYDLPIGVCSLGKDMEVLSWNRAMVELTGISDAEVIGSALGSLPNPWRDLLSDFVTGSTAHVYRRKIECNGLPRWVSLNRALVGDGEELLLDDSQVVVIEDITAIHMLESQLTHSQRLASVGRLAAGVAHEIGNPITGIACLAQNLKAETNDEETREISEQIIDQTQRVSRIVQSLVGFSRADNHSTQHTEPVVIHDCVQEAINLLRLVPGGRDYQFVNECDPDAIAAGDVQRLTQVFINLISNARDASPVGSAIIVRCHGNEHSVKIEVEDFGTGLPTQIRDSLFEPFVTTKETGKGTGLGLALVHGIIEEHYGKIQLVDKADYDQGHGAIAQITLPGYQPLQDLDAENQTNSEESL